MIGYFQKSGDEIVSDLFGPYLWRDKGFDTVLEHICFKKSYGTDLKLLLIQYYVEGKFDIGAPIEPKLSNYSNKNKDIAVAIPITRDKFHDVSDRKRRQFIVKTTLQAIDMVENRLGKRKLDINFKQLRKDVIKAAEEYLSQE